MRGSVASRRAVVAERLALRIDIRLARVLFHPMATGKSTTLENSRMEYATARGDIGGKML
jgi:hypothetical protein